MKMKDPTKTLKILFCFDNNHRYQEKLQKLQFQIFDKSLEKPNKLHEIK